jgi:C-5 cytosine-specific DNA methylase
LVEPPETPKGCHFTVFDVMQITADDIRDWKIDFAVASSPCEQFSVFGMKHFHPNPPYPEIGIMLFNHTRKILEAAGVPYVMENVRAAQQFLGNAVHHCGPFYLWGSAVPPLMPRGIGKGTHDIKGVAVNRSRRFYFDTRAGKNVAITEKAAWKETSSGSKARKEFTAQLSTIPPELANCVAEYAERITEQRMSA